MLARYRAAGATCLRVIRNSASDSPVRSTIATHTRQCRRRDLTTSASSKISAFAISGSSAEHLHRASLPNHRPCHRRVSASCQTESVLQGRAFVPGHPARAQKPTGIAPRRHDTVGPFPTASGGRADRELGDGDGRRTHWGRWQWGSGRHGPAAPSRRGGNRGREPPVPTAAPSARTGRRRRRRCPELDRAGRAGRAEAFPSAVALRRRAKADRGSHRPVVARLRTRVRLGAEEDAEEHDRHQLRRWSLRGRPLPADRQAGFRAVLQRLVRPAVSVSGPTSRTTSSR